MDKILNLSAFGDVMNPFGHTDKEDKSEPASEPIPTKGLNPDDSKYSYVFKMILQNMAQTKLLHWQSMLYGQHKALDGLFDGIIDKGDELAEIIMGKYGRPVLNEEQLCLKLMNYADPEKGDLSDFMDHLYRCYSLECKSIFGEKRDPEILNIIDELIALIDQTKYLISLR